MRASLFGLPLTIAMSVALTGCFGAPQADNGNDAVDAGESFVTPGPTTAPTTGGPSNDPDTTGSPGTSGNPDTPVDAGPEEEEPAATATISKADAARFLTQAGFGANEVDVEGVRRLGYAGWIEWQMSLPVRPLTDRVLALDEPTKPVVTDLFWEYAIDGEDQLRQRTAYALSQIMVISLDHPFWYRRPEGFTTYMDALQRGAFGNYGDALEDVTFTPAMGRYLSSLGNKKADPELGSEPDENFAREVMQLFTIGLEELTPGGEPTGKPTYGVEDIKGLAAVFTGLSFADTTWDWPQETKENRMARMVGFPQYHEPGPKRFLGTTIDHGSDAEASVKAALAHLVAHDNVAPFVTKQLIQRMVTSNPSPAYVARVGSAFETGQVVYGDYSFGEGRRGDMAATVAAILLDPEARNPGTDAAPGYGRVREPVLRFAHFARVFRDEPSVGPQGAPLPTGGMRWEPKANRLGQMAYGPSSVFGFSRPGYVAPASWSGNAGLVAPELSMAGGTAATGFIDLIMAMIERSDPNEAAFRMDWSRYHAVADDADALVDALGDVLAFGTLEQQTEDRILSALAEIPRERDDQLYRDRRIQLATMMIVTSPEFGVQR